MGRTDRLDLDVPKSNIQKFEWIVHLRHQHWNGIQEIRIKKKNKCTHNRDSSNDQLRTEVNAIITDASNIKAEETINDCFNTQKRDTIELTDYQIVSSYELFT